jgi:hypothetical protein
MTDETFIRIETMIDTRDPLVIKLCEQDGVKVEDVEHSLEFFKKVEVCLKRRKGQEGFMLVNLLLMSAILIPLMSLAFSITVKLNTVINKYNKLSSVGTPMHTCKVNENCQGSPIFCLYEPSNNKDVQSCAGKCSFDGSVWKYENKVCTQGVVL